MKLAGSRFPGTSGIVFHHQNGRIGRSDVGMNCRFVIASMRRVLPVGAVLLVSFGVAIGAEHWAFQPVRTVEPPAVRDSSWIRTPIDRFILSKLESARLKPSPQANREKLIRRISFGLTGLPPTPAEA